MTWLVTGGSGFLGLHLLRRLGEQGIAARSLDLVPLEEAPPGIEGITGDVRDTRLLRDVVDGVDIVVHAAAALPSGGDLDAVNVRATAALADLCRAAGVTRSIFVSSAVVYGLQLPLVSESAEPRPVEAYGRSKLAAERAWLARAPAPLVLRPSAFVGPERLGVFAILFRWIREGRRIYVLGDGTNRYQLLDVGDLVVGLERAAAGSAEGVVNLGGRVSGSVRSDLEGLIAHAGSPSHVVGVPAKPAKALLAMLDTLRLSPLGTWHRVSADHDLVLDCGRAESLLGWRPSRSGLEALVRAYDWYCAAAASRPVGRGHRSAWRERSLGVLRRIS
ncbi:MAG: NAD-dependent epimerase/dehydratase family protein [Actinobacteria bacterium]|nr:NAD-dependent epimerase/dehydratase family protein [Actinomycetota bacterium]